MMALVPSLESPKSCLILHCMLFIKPGFNNSAILVYCIDEENQYQCFGFGFIILSWGRKSSNPCFGPHQPPAFPCLEHHDALSITAPANSHHPASMSNAQQQISHPQALMVVPPTPTL